MRNVSYCWSCVYKRDYVLNNQTLVIFNFQLLELKFFTFPDEIKTSLNTFTEIFVYNISLLICTFIPLFSQFNRFQPTIYLYK